jgi:hypothetical protein
MSHKIGDSCPHCGEGTLELDSSTEIYEKDDKSEFGSTRQFRCDKCNRTVRNRAVGITEKVNFSDDIEAKKS